jgi:hypothetical protein
MMKFLFFAWIGFVLGCTHLDAQEVVEKRDVYWYESLSSSTYVNQNGEFLDLPENYSSVKKFDNGIALIVIREIVPERLLPIRTYAYVDDSLNKLLTFSSRDRENRGDLHEGLYVYLEDDKLGYKDFDGWVIPPVWDDGSDFSDGVVSVIRDQEEFFIDRTGEILFSLDESRERYGYKNAIVSRFINGYARVFDEYSLRAPRTTYIDKRGERISDWHEGEGTFFYEGYAVIQRYPGGPCYFINEQGEVAEELGEHDFATRFSNGLAAVMESGSFGYMDTQGKMVIPKRFNFATPFVDGFAAVSFNEPYIGVGYRLDIFGEAFFGGGSLEGIGRYGIIDKEGKVVVPPIYSDIPKIYPGGVAEVTELNEDGSKYKLLLINLNEGGRKIDETSKWGTSFKSYIVD